MRFNIILFNAIVWLRRNLKKYILGTYLVFRLVRVQLESTQFYQIMWKTKKPATNQIDPFRIDRRMPPKTEILFCLTFIRLLSMWIFLVSHIMCNAFERYRNAIKLCWHVIHCWPYMQIGHFYSDFGVTDREWVILHLLEWFLRSIPLWHDEDIF